MITTLYKSNVTEFRKGMIRGMLRQLTKPVGRPALTSEEWQLLLAQANTFLQAQGQKPLTLDAIFYGLDGKDCNGKKLIKDALAAKGYSKKDFNRAMDRVIQECETVEEALTLIEGLPTVKR